MTTQSCFDSAEDDRYLGSNDWEIQNVRCGEIQCHTYVSLHPKGGEEHAILTLDQSDGLQFLTGFLQTF